MATKVKNLVPDFSVTDDGCFVVLYANNDAAQEYMEENVECEVTWMGGAVVSHAFGNALIRYLEDNGFSIAYRPDYP